MVVHQNIAESDYKAASRRLAAIFDASPGTKEFNELNYLYHFLEQYEKGGQNGEQNEKQETQANPIADIVRTEAALSNYHAD